MNAISGTRPRSIRHTDASSGEFVLLLNSDVALTPGALSSLSAVPRRSSGRGRGRTPVREPGRLTAAVSFPVSDLRDDAGERKRARAQAPARKQTRQLREYRMLDEDFSQPRPVPQPSASCLLLRRSIPSRRPHLRRALSDLLQRRPACTLVRRSRLRPLGHAFCTGRSRRAFVDPDARPQPASGSISAPSFACSPRRKPQPRCGSTARWSSSRTFLSRRLAVATR